MLQTKTVIIQAQSKQFRNRHQHQYIQKRCQGIVLSGVTESNIPKSPTPTSGQKHDKHNCTEPKVGDPQPAAASGLSPWLGRILRNVHFDAWRAPATIDYAT